MMKRLMALLLTVLLCFTAATALAEGVTFTVQGTAAITATPDVVSVSANAMVNAASAMEAQSQISEMIARLRTALLELGLTDDDIVTQNYSFYPQYDYVDGRENLVGYQANHSIEITCRDLNKLNEVLTAVTESGVTQLYSITYGVSTRNEIYRRALCDAIRAAREKAELMAASCGYDELAMTSVEEQGNYIGVTMYASNDLRDEAAAAEKVLDTGINAGSISVSASVEVVFTAK